MKELHQDPELRVGVVTGTGDEAFIAGADLHILKVRTPEMAVEASKKANEILLSMEAMEEPMIAAINGWALGGGCVVISRSPFDTLRANGPAYRQAGNQLILNMSFSVRGEPFDSPFALRALEGTNGLLRTGPVEP
ncbi:MAG: enoyl-CoA hydratase-related protein [Thermodesulfobacteriota bacterium]|nr:enoyl-CoA hydratase-related protein [Thermodesulfobacteriota bacterium]